MGYDAMQFFIYLPVACVKAAIPDHFIMLFRDMLDKALYEFHNGDSFFYISIIFMAVVMKGNKHWDFTFLKDTKMPRKTLVFELCSELEQELIRQQLCTDTLKRYRKILKEFSVFGGERVYSQSLGTVDRLLCETISIIQSGVL